MPRPTRSTRPMIALPNRLISTRAKRMLQMASQMRQMPTNPTRAVLRRTSAPTLSGQPYAEDDGYTVQGESEVR